MTATETLFRSVIVLRNWQVPVEWKEIIHDPNDPNPNVIGVIKSTGWTFENYPNNKSLCRHHCWCNRWPDTDRKLLFLMMYDSMIILRNRGPITQTQCNSIIIFLFKFRLRRPLMHCINVFFFFNLFCSSQMCNMYWNMKPCKYTATDRLNDIRIVLHVVFSDQVLLCFTIILFFY